ncbi:MAG: hypothetical protein AB7Q97_01620 [Gammaproteobacteria bacterium]
MPNKRTTNELDEDEDDELQSSKRQRVRRAPLLSAINALPEYWDDPNYKGKSEQKAGSDSVSVTLGPNACNARSNDADPDLPEGIELARKTYPECNFKAGHMRNCDLGGNGKNWKNLTILTSSANTAMTKYDNALKRAAEQLKKVYESIYKDFPEVTERDLKDIEFGIDLEIRTEGTWGKSAPDSYICNKVKYSARIHGDVPDEYQSRDVLSAMKAVKDEIGKCNGKSVDNK